MADIVNLRRERKRRAREEKAEEAAANRAASGQPKALREAGERARARAETRLDDHRLERSGPQGEAP